MRQKEYKPLPEKHLWQLALHTGQWCRAVLCQAHRFFDALEADNRPLPWDDSESFDMFLADKTFLITAIHHSIVNMCRTIVPREKYSTCYRRKPQYTVEEK